MNRLYCSVLSLLIGIAFTVMLVLMYVLAQQSGLMLYEFGIIASLDTESGHTINIYAESHDDPGQPLTYEIHQGDHLTKTETYLCNYQGSSRSLNLTLIQPTGVNTAGLVMESAPTDLLALFVLDQNPHAIGCSTEAERKMFCSFQAATENTFDSSSHCDDCSGSPPSGTDNPP